MMQEGPERPILVSATFRSPETAVRLELDLSFLRDSILFEKDEPGPDETVEIRILCPDHDIAYDIMQILDEKYFSDDAQEGHL